MYVSKEEKIKELENKGLRLYTLAEITEVTGICDRTLKRCIVDGRLKATKICNRWRVSEQELNRFTKKQ